MYKEYSAYNESNKGNKTRRAVMNCEHRNKNGAGTDFGKIERYISEHYRESITIKGIAGSLYISSSYLGALFARYAGVSIKEYIHSLRIAEIVEGMSDENKTIKELVYEAGYNNYNNFFSWFSRFTGTSPEEFRKTLWLI